MIKFSHINLSSTILLKFLVISVIGFVEISGRFDKCAVAPCMNDGVCYSNYDDFYCKCSPCYSGEYCEVNGCLSTSKVSFIFRCIFLIITLVLGILAVFMFIYRLNTIVNEKTIYPRRIPGTKLSSSVSTTINGKKALIVDSNATVTDSLCNLVYSAAKEHSMNENELLREHIINWYDKQNKSQDKTPKRRVPPWDEVEMRRHGLVSRNCNRIFFQDCPSNPATIEVSEYNNTTGNDYGVITYGQTPDTSTFQSNQTTPLATSTPTSEASGKTVLSGSTAKSGTTTQGTSNTSGQIRTQNTQQTTNPQQSVYLENNLN